MMAELRRRRTIDPEAHETMALPSSCFQLTYLFACAIEKVPW